MTDRNKRTEREGFGDDQGTRIGPPTPASREEVGDTGFEPSGRTGAGAEATEGMHTANGDRNESDRTALDGKATGRKHGKPAGPSGSEPIESHDREHQSKYGGGGPHGGVKD